MKRILCMMLACLLLCACGKTQTQSETTEPAYKAQQPTLSPTEPESDEEILAYRRDLVEAEMRRCMATLWTPAQDITYYVKEGDTEPIVMKAGRIYQGLPYTHASGSAYGFFSYATSQDEKGVYTLTGLDSIHLSGGLYARQGCDCADTVFWAWSKISTSVRARFTAEMTENYGIVKVGDYVCNLPKYVTTTKPICTENGEDVMFRSYAQLQKGDAMVLYTKSSGGHAVMVTDTIVNYTADGKIDADNSYVVIIEQTSEPQRAQEHYYNEEIGQEVYVCGAVDSCWSFATIFKKGYLPVTCKELVDPSPLTEEKASITGTAQSLNDLYRLSIDATRRIVSVTVTVSQKGKTVQQATAYGTEDNYTTFSMLPFADPLEQAVMQGSLDPDALKSGKYHCTITCLLATGNTHTVLEFDFTV